MKRDGWAKTLSVNEAPPKLCKDEFIKGWKDKWMKRDLLPYPKDKSLKRKGNRGQNIIDFK